MDGRIRWLRRLLIWRISRRLAAESIVASAAVFCAAFIAEIDVAVCAVLALSTAQLYSVSRLIGAVTTNPISHRYLMKWEDLSGQLKPIAAESPRSRSLDEVLSRSGFSHAVRLGVDGIPDGLNVYEATAKQVAVATSDHGEPFVVLSRVSGDRILVTTSEVVPPSNGVIVNQSSGSPLPELVEAHMKRLTTLQTAGVQAQQTDHRAVIEQHHLEWHAWDQLGPFVGPFLAVGARRQPLTMQIRVDPETLWLRSSRDALQKPASESLTKPQLAPAFEPEPPFKTEPESQPAAWTRSRRSPANASSAPPAETPASIYSSITTGPPPMPGPEAKLAPRSLGTPAGH